jgi:hypothetical protein
MKKLTYLTAAASAVLALTFTSSVYSQADSGSVPPLRGTPRILPLSMQERETPVTNNITNTTNQITERVQPNTYSRWGGQSGGGAGTWLATAYAYCNAGDTVISGGGSCTSNSNSFGRAKESYPVGGGWAYQCGADENGSDGRIWATANVVCSN